MNAHHPTGCPNASQTPQPSSEDDCAPCRLPLGLGNLLRLSQSLALADFNFCLRVQVGDLQGLRADGELRVALGFQRYSFICDL